MEYEGDQKASGISLLYNKHKQLLLPSSLEKDTAMQLIYIMSHWMHPSDRSSGYLRLLPWKCLENALWLPARLIQPERRILLWPVTQLPLGTWIGP